jgi:hypothetical protein
VLADQRRARILSRWLSVALLAFAGAASCAARAQPLALEPLPADAQLRLNLAEQGAALVLELRLPHAAGALRCRTLALVSARSGSLLSIRVLGLKRLPADSFCASRKDPTPSPVRVRLPQDAGDFELELVSAGVRDRYRLQLDAQRVSLELVSDAALTQATTLGELRRFPDDWLLVALQWTPRPGVDVFAAERALLHHKLVALGAEPIEVSGRFLIGGEVQPLPQAPDPHNAFVQSEKRFYRYRGDAGMLEMLVAEFARFHQVPLHDRPSLGVWLKRRDSVASTYGAWY